MAHLRAAEKQKNDIEGHRARSINRPPPRGLECDLSENAVNQAFERVSAADTEEKTIDLWGIFRGATLDTWRFDFRTEIGEQITGRLGDEVSNEQALEMIPLTDQRCLATLNQTVVKTRSGALRTRYELLSLAQQRH